MNTTTCTECTSQGFTSTRPATVCVQIPALTYTLAPAFWVPVCERCVSAFNDDVRVVEFAGA